MMNLIKKRAPELAIDLLEGMIKVRDQEIKYLKEEVAELEEIIERDNTKIGYLITKRVFKKHGLWKPHQKRMTDEHP